MKRENQATNGSYFLCILMCFLVACTSKEDAPVPLATLPSKLSYLPDNKTIKEGTGTFSPLPSVEGSQPIKYYLLSENRGGKIFVDSTTGVIGFAPTLELGTYQISIKSSNAVGNASFSNVYMLTVSKTANAVNYTNSIKPIMDKYCVSCHTLFSTYADVKFKIGDILNRTQRPAGSEGVMPKGGSLSAAELQLLRDWQAAGMPEN